MENIVAVAIGGAIGAVSRWLLTIVIQHKVEGAFPYGTMLVNLIGSLLIGLCMSYFLQKTELPLWVKLFVVTGGLGGLTTFSTFTAEWLALLESGSYGGALFYGGVQLLGGLLLCSLGFWLGRVIGS